MIKQIEARVTGRVQMVMYRDFAERKARGLGIVGTVQNIDDGSVRVIAQGDEQTLKKYIDKLNGGSVLSKVQNVEVVYNSDLDNFQSFEIIY